MTDDDEKAAIKAVERLLAKRGYPGGTYIRAYNIVHNLALAGLTPADLAGLADGTRVVVPVDLIAGLMWNDMQDTDADGLWHEQPEDMRAGWIKILPEYIAEEAARPGANAQVRDYADTLSAGTVLRDEFLPARPGAKEGDDA